jgi:hypothetical protein
VNGVGEWAVNFFVNLVFKAGMFGFQRLDTIVHRHAMSSLVEKPNKDVKNATPLFGICQAVPPKEGANAGLCFALA